MKENSYLSPEKIREQCDAVICKLEKDNETMGMIEQSIGVFMTDTRIVSEAFEALRQQLFDYIMVLHTMREANQTDIKDFRLLKALVGFQELDGNVILKQKDSAMSEKKADEKNAEKYRKMARATNSATLRVQYSMKVANYLAMAELDQKLYDEWQKKENTYDGIERMTSGMFEEGAAIRATAEQALKSIQGAFQNGGYVPDMSASWRSDINALFNTQITYQNPYVTNTDKAKIEGEWKKQLLKMGYTQEEIDMLCMRGISLTETDIHNLKLTVGNEKVYRSEDAKALMYNGKIYYIYVPSNEPAYESKNWQMDWKKELTKVDFDLAAGTLGISLEDIPKEEVYVANNRYKVQETGLSNGDKNAMVAGTLHVLMGVQSFLAAALNHTEITLVFETNKADKRVMIMVGDSQTRLKFQQMDYNMPINTYQSANDWMGEKYASDYAKGIYQAVTGEHVSDENAAYTITGTLDEGHRECNISGYLSYSENGELLYSPLVLPGDTAHVSRCMEHTGYFPYEILEFTDLLENPVMADEDVRKILEEALEGNEDGK